MTTVDNSSSLTPLFEKICTVCTIGLFLTGTQICARIYRMHSTGDISGFPFVATFLNCSLWCLYGYSANNSAILLVNTIGACLQAGYVLFYIRYSQDRTAYLRLVLSAVAFLACVSYYLQYYLVDNRTIIYHTGLICCFMTVIMFGAPLASLKEVILKKSTDSLSFPLCFANFIVASEWAIYGVLISDKFVQIPNGLGAILGIIQVSLFLKYPRDLLPKVTNLGPV